MEFKKEVYQVLLRPDAPYSEVADTIGDALEVANAIEAAVADGVQFTDAIALFEQRTNLIDLFASAKVFVEQFTQLNPATAKQAVLEARTRIVTGNQPVGKAATFILGFLYNTATGFGFVSDVVIKGQAQTAQWAALFAGTDPVEAEAAFMRSLTGPPLAIRTNIDKPAEPAAAASPRIVTGEAAFEPKRKAAMEGK